MNTTPRIAGALSALVVAVAVGVAFGSTLGGGFLMDDHFFLKTIHFEGGLRRTIEDLTGNWLGFTGYAYYRPLVTLSFAVDHAVFGLAPWGYHLTNLLLHLANAFLVLVLTRRLYPAAGRLGALAAALLFATHPVHPNAVGWVAARSDLLAGLGTLGMLAAYHAAWTRRRLWPQLAGLALFAGALLAKESGVVAVVLALVLPARGVGVRRRLAALAPAAVLLAAYGGVRLLVLEPGLDLHQGAAPTSAEGLLRALRSLLGQLGRVANPAGADAGWLTLGPLLFLAPALPALLRRGGAALGLFALAFTGLSLAPVLPILGHMDPSLFAGYSRYWYLAVIGLVWLAALAVGGAGRFGAVPFVAFLVLAASHGALSRARFERDLKRPARMVAGIAALLERQGGGAGHRRINVFLCSPDNRYAGVHVNKLAFPAAAVRPFITRDVPLYPLTLEELTALIRVHGGHRAFLVVTVDARTGNPEVVASFPRPPRLGLATTDGPYRLDRGLWKDVDLGGRSPLSFDLVRLEGLKGTGRLLVQLETDAGVFGLDRLATAGLDRLAHGAGGALDFTFRSDPDFLRARAVTRLRLEPCSVQDNPLEGVVEVGRIVLEDLETRRFLVSPAPGARVRASPSPPVLRWSDQTPRELGLRFVTVFGFHPPLADPPLRPRDGIPPALQEKIQVGTRLGTGWFLIFATPPAIGGPDTAPPFRVPLHPLAAERP